MMIEITDNDIQNMTSLELAVRMDKIFFTYKEETNPSIELTSDFITGNLYIKKIINSEYVAKLEECHKKHICHLLFKTFLQMEYTDKAIGSREYGGFNSPKTQIYNAAKIQNQIISSRITVEYFMVLIYYIYNKKEIDIKFIHNNFKKWLKNNTDCPFFCTVVPIISKMRAFDKKFRIDEVHASSKLSKGILQMSDLNQSGGQFNERMTLADSMLNIWDCLLYSLNGARSNCLKGRLEDFKRWKKECLDASAEQRKKYLDDMIGN